MLGRILVPFDNLLHLQEALYQALELAENLAAEVVLLRVNLPESRLSPHFDEEYLYSELKALQAQCAALPVAVHIEAAGGPVKEAIVHYAAEHEISLIFSPEIARLVNQTAAAPKKRELDAQKASGAPLGNGVATLTGNTVLKPAQGVAGAR